MNKITLTGGQLIPALQAFNSLLSQKMPLNGALAVMRAAKAVQNSIQSIQEVANADAATCPENADDEDRQKAAAAVYEDAIGRTFTLSVRPFPPGLLGTIQVTPLEAMALEPFIAEPANI